MNVITPPRVVRDYELHTFRTRNATMGEVFNAVDGLTLAKRTFTGLWHGARARLWARWNTRRHVAHLAWRA